MSAGRAHSFARRMLNEDSCLGCARSALPTIFGEHTCAKRNDFWGVCVREAQGFGGLWWVREAQISITDLRFGFAKCAQNFSKARFAQHALRTTRASRNTRFAQRPARLAYGMRGFPGRGDTRRPYFCTQQIAQLLITSSSSRRAAAAA